MKTMSIEELKEEIVQALDGLSKSELNELLLFTVDLKKKTFLDQESLEKILSEDKNLLTRLAQ